MNWYLIAISGLCFLLAAASYGIRKLRAEVRDLTRKAETVNAVYMRGWQAGRAYGRGAGYKKGWSLGYECGRAGRKPPIGPVVLADSEGGEHD